MTAKAAQYAWPICSVAAMRVSEKMTATVHSASGCILIRCDTSSTNFL